MASNNKSNAAGGGGGASSELGVGAQSTSQNISNQISFGMMQMQSSPSSSLVPVPVPVPTNFIRNKDGGGNYDLGELDQAFFLYLDHEGPSGSAIQEQKQNSVMRPPTLNIFPSQPMYVEPSQPKCDDIRQEGGSRHMNVGGISTPSVGSKRPSMDLSYSNIPPKAVKREGSDKGPASSLNNEEERPPKTADPKTLRRLAQNREAARKSRLRKKAYIQQLESSRIKLTQLEQQYHTTPTHSQGVYIGGGSALLGGGQDNIPLPMPNISPATAFDIEYRRWVKEHHQIMCELRNAMQEVHLQENELRLYVNNCVAHLDELMNLKSMLAKADVFHLLSGAWKTPAERCFMWLGGFRPFQLIKIIMREVGEPLTEQQVIGICGIQQTAHEAEESLSHGLQNLNQSLSDTIVSDALSYPTDMPNYMAYMTLAINKLSTVEGFVRQADNLRQQAIHQLLQILTTRQAARCCLAMAEYFHRLRALSSLWLARPAPAPAVLARQHD